MKILITGGAGFIGSNFARHIIRNRPDWGVTVLDKLTYAGNPANVADLKSYDRFQFVQGDICDPHLMAETIPGHDCIVNFAAETHVDRSLARADDFLRTAVIGTNVMLEIVRKHKDIRYIQISTDEVYGSFDIGSATEESPIVPRNPYSASKAGGDLLALSYFKSFGLDVIVTRSSNNFGPFQYPEKVMPLFITNLLEGKPIPLYGDGMNIRDWLFVEDNCTAILLALEEGNAGEVYNIGGGRLSNCSILEAIAFCENICGHPMKVTLVDSPRRGDHIWWISDIRKFETQCPDWKLTRNISDILRDIHDKNRDYWLSGNTAASSW